jgi:hypothetical protein
MERAGIIIVMCCAMELSIQSSHTNKSICMWGEQPAARIMGNIKAVVVNKTLENVQK